MDWYCIQIEQHRLSHAINLTFRNMLIEEYRHHGALDNCRVYRQIQLGSYTYLFCTRCSQGAAGLRGILERRAGYSARGPESNGCRYLKGWAFVPQ